ncbi:MAG: adenine phosphoribosyltransferase [Candidatus Buchananbacteria bacterium RIFCSPHIGHO2_02_FULL_38_8]|uniref:Adenine phosphoribosyltransferase n=2 Tax=Candidatus Buchananiibacteriota TaxID=1817903 RepID=A0A1G1XXU9_9BACT|nr:MAG: adenine phosphoribosyltransferase [Candidatus Buchananbacteria bacterium RIFCSPHIGHO2_01_FULL_39_8]OGY47282.1 MAG: adenine phosphoribosyltransferase [Candidatus Buchananbacteria bacterium RIFCSPHIGHO2_02_FULL_38_8]
MNMERNYLDQKIRKIPNFPKEGILFYDVTTLFEDAEVFKKVIDELSQPYAGQKIDKIVGIDARGFLLASTMAYKLGAGISIVRKKGKLPYKTHFATYQKEYGPDTIEMHEDTIKPGEKVIIVDDLLATGGTMLATIDLVKQMGGEIVGIDFVINLTFLPGEKLLKENGYSIHYLISYDNEDVKKADQN